MAEASGNGIVKEGFLCPCCHKDLRAPKQLLAHFQEEHSEEQDILKSLKDLVYKAKKILKPDEEEFETFKPEPAIHTQEYDFEIVKQDIGTVISHTALFKDIRRDRLDHQATETNKLIIRLDRLLKVEGNDRRQHEQNVVEWLDGSAVSRCPSCTKSFNITRRQHHCRLCGSIMCNSCTCFLPLDIAKSLVTAVFNETLQPIELTTETDSLRVCTHCMTMLENRRISQYNQITEPHVCKLYRQLQTLKQKLQPNVDLYDKMYSSLVAGETTFHYEDAQSLRNSILKQAEVVGAISKKIATLPNDSHPKVQALQTAVNRATTHYIKDYLLTLPTLPTPQELKGIRESRAEQHAAESQKREMQSGGRSRQSDIHKKIVVTTGWSPAAVSPRESVRREDIPDAEGGVELSESELLVMQMNNVREYIKQAREAQRFEEMAILSNNLRELKNQYLQIQQKYN